MAPQAEQVDDSLQPVDTIATREPSSTGSETGAETDAELGADVALTVGAVDPGDPGADGELAAMAGSPSVSYVAHVQNVGWQSWVRDGATAEPPDGPCAWRR